MAYLNTKPLIFGLEDRLEGFANLHLALPSQLASQMQDRRLDIGLIPVVEFLRNRKDYRLISDAGIACRGPVWSVRILFRVPPEQVRSLGTDEGSRTSVALSQVLLASRFGRLPDLVPFPIDSEPKDCPADAVLVIGDRAMNPERFRLAIVRVPNEDDGVPLVRYFLKPFNEYEPHFAQTYVPLKVADLAPHGLDPQ